MDTVKFRRTIKTPIGFVIIWSLSSDSEAIDGIILLISQVNTLGDGATEVKIVKRIVIPPTVQAFHVTSLIKGRVYQFEVRAKSGKTTGTPIIITRRF